MPEFGREARNFVHAVVSAVFDVMRTGAKIERIEPDYLVSLSEIAKRSGLSRSAVSLSQRVSAELTSRCRLLASQRTALSGIG